MKKEIEKDSLLNRWKNKAKKEDLFGEISKAPDNAHIPLSSGQQSLWFLQQSQPENSFYNYSELYTLKGNLRVDLLFKSLEVVFTSNNILLSYYRIENDIITQKVASNIPITVTQFDLSTYSPEEKKTRKDAILLTDATTYFDLSKAPLFRLSLLKLDAKEHILFVTMHHIVTDKWSMGLFREQLAKHYLALSSNEFIAITQNALQYRDYAYWQESNPINKDQLAYWKSKLSGDIPVLELAFNYPRPQEPSFTGKHNQQSFSHSLSKAILELSKELETTPFVFLLSVYYVLLYRYSSQTDIFIGSPISNRNEKVLEEVFGFFNDTIVLRTKLQPQQSFASLVREVKKTTLEAFSNKDVPFEVLVKELKPERTRGINPLFQVMFLYHSTPNMPSFGPELSVEHSNFDSNASKFDLTLYIAEENGLLSSIFEYSTDLYDADTITQFQEHYKLLLEHIVLDPQTNIDRIPMQTSFEKDIYFPKKSEQQNNFENYQGIHDIISKVSAVHPNAIALVFNNNSLTYLELEEQSTAVAKYLLKLTAEKKTIIGLCIERSMEMIVGLLGILKAGCAYMPLDPEYPSHRINFMITDAEVDIILTEASLAAKFKSLVTHVVNLTNVSDQFVHEAIQLPRVNRKDLAYVIYTSGSTGKPKGVPISHDNIIKSTAGRLTFYPENPSVFLLLSSIAFDSSKAGIFWTLCTGGNLVISQKRMEQDIEGMAKLIAEHDISHSLMLPSLYELILKHSETDHLKTLKAIILAGEACLPSVCTMHFNALPHVLLYNEYGPTEATVWCTAHEIKQEDLNGPIPIGKPVAGATLLILNDQMKRVPLGAIGEIYIGGDGLSHAYINRAELSQKVFAFNPYAINEKLYKTGDLGKYRKDGSIEFLGRSDQQIKIRGFRVELEEIEKTILTFPEVHTAIVLARDNATNSSSKRLVAYITGNLNLDTAALKHCLKGLMPNHMIPSSLVQIEKIPRLPNGKVDKNALAVHKEESSGKFLSTDQPVSEFEKLLTSVWEEVLAISPIGITDNFFEIGGDSILSIQIIAKARKLGIVLKPNQIFESQTIAELTLFAESEALQKVEDSIVLGEVPLTPIQHWFFDLHKAAPHYWNQAVELRNIEGASQDILKQYISSIAIQHDALRSSFHQKNGKWINTILDPSKIEAFISVNLVHHSEKYWNTIKEETLKSTQETFELSKGSLFKCLFFETGDAQKNTLILVAHHLIIDMVSWEIIVSDLVEHITVPTTATFKYKKTSSIQKWGNYLHTLSSSNKLNEEQIFWEKQLGNVPKLPQDLKGVLPIREKDIEVVPFQLPKTASQLLMGNANTTYNTKTDELLLVALTESISHWANIQKLPIALERHGRETHDNGIDLSNTVGWFTAFFPILLQTRHTENTGEKIIAVKETIRKIPNGGLGYGLLKYVTRSLPQTDFPQVVFNFLGKKNEVQGGHATSIMQGMRHELSERNYFIEINAIINNGVLEMNWSYPNTIYNKSTIQQLITNFEQCLLELLAHCSDLEKGKYTPSDFPEADLNQDDLDNLLNLLE